MMMPSFIYMSHAACISKYESKEVHLAAWNWNLSVAWLDGQILMHHCFIINRVTLLQITGSLGKESKREGHHLAGQLVPSSM
jgi:hypothetical protein